MKLDDFLKTQKVRCVKAYGDCLTVGKEYNVIDVSVEIKIKDDEGGFLYWESDSFEPVIDDIPKSAENLLQKMELTPEFEAEASEPKFRVGDPVYCPLQTKELCKVFSNDQEFQPQCPLTITEVRSRHSGVSGAVVACVDDYGYSDEYDNAPFIFHATPENHALLSQLYPHIKFEAPLKPLTGSDLCRAMLEKGWKYVPCYVHDGSDDEAINRKHYVSVKNETPRSGYNFSGTGANDWKYAVPIDPRTGEPITESILND